MYIGTQIDASVMHALGDRYLRQLSQFGIRHVCIDPPGDPKGWDYDDIQRHVEHIDRHGLILDMIQLPLSSRPIEQSQSPGIMLGRSPDRDREIEAVCKIIELLASAGIPAAKYNLNILGIPRTPPELGRGGSSHEAFRLPNSKDGHLLSAAGRVSSEEVWERIDYFLERVVPVAEANQVRIACHPHDPCTPDGWRGIGQTLGTVDGLKRFVGMRESAYHGLNFCQGTIAESLEDPASEIGDVIRWFGARSKIFNVHFRNISGGRYSFREEFPDAGDMNMVESFRLYAKVGYKYMIMPDHVPKIDGEAPFETAFAFCFGYITALFQAQGLDASGPAKAAPAKNF